MWLAISTTVVTVYNTKFDGVITYHLIHEISIRHLTIWLDYHQCLVWVLCIA